MLSRFYSRFLLPVFCLILIHTFGGCQWLARDKAADEILVDERLTSSGAPRAAAVDPIAEEPQAGFDQEPTGLPEANPN